MLEAVPAGLSPAPRLALPSVVLAITLVLVCPEPASAGPGRGPTEGLDASSLPSRSTSAGVHRQAVGINLMDIVRALIRKGPGKDQVVSKGIKVVDPAKGRKASVRVVDEPDAGIVMLISLEATARDLIAHTARLIPQFPSDLIEGSLPRPPVRDLRILRLEMPERSGEQEVVVILLDPETLDALADAPEGSQLELAGWDETLRLELSRKALRELGRFRDRIASGRIGGR